MKLFNGFALDMASEFTGLSKGEIRWLVKTGIITPQRDGNGAFCYAFRELLMLRLVKLLKINRVKVKDIKQARKYIRTIDEKKDLTKIQLYLRTDTNDILYLGEQPQDGVFVNMSKFGQLVQKNALSILPVGRDLEHMRSEVVDLDKSLSNRMKSKKLVSMDEVFAKYGLG
ncbi:MAG: MerR family transcriptional regulator [Candidatus Obscuribacterales bacterium]|nr:MerR family transcriptional regulator [Candidatus Obscuribacterales bacterium]